jgi:hypothetical protein
MRPGMPLGRKHFRRSRDAPIYYGKTVASPVVKDRLSLKTSFYHNRWQPVIKSLDDAKLPGDSEGNLRAELNLKAKWLCDPEGNAINLQLLSCVVWAWKRIGVDAGQTPEKLLEDQWWRSPARNVSRKSSRCPFWGVYTPRLVR